MEFWQYLPLNIKNFWIYKTAEKFSEDYSLTRVIINEKIPLQNKIIYVFTYYLDDEEIKKESFVLQEDGIFLYARKIENNLVVFDPLLPFLPYNFMYVDWWSWEGKVGTLSTKIVFKNNKFVEENTVKIVYEEENKLGKSTYSIFIKKDVGIVREEAETPYMGYSSELVDYNVSFDDFSFINFREYQTQEDEIGEYEDFSFQRFVYREGDNAGEEFAQEFSEEDFHEEFTEELTEEFNEDFTDNVEDMYEGGIENPDMIDEFYEDFYDQEEDDNEDR